jgi:hypothetical protein
MKAYWGIRKDREMVERLAALERENIQLRQLANVLQDRYDRANRQLARIRSIAIGASWDDLDDVE